MFSNEIKRALRNPIENEMKNRQGDPVYFTYSSVMSSINSHFTFNYSQPTDYRFSHDSVFLAREVFEYLKNTNKFNRPLRILDLCSGCGVIGLDFAFHTLSAQVSESTILTSKSPLVLDIDFLEIQEVYRPHFEKNVETLRSFFPEASTNFSFLNMNYECLQDQKFHKKYDVIISNPPYFLSGQGKMSPSEFKNRCRFFLDSDLKNLIQSIDNSISESGQCFILLRDLSDHGFDQKAEARKHLSPTKSIEDFIEIRGTSVVLIKGLS